MAKETILVVEDEKNIVELVQYNLQQEGFKVLKALKGDEGLECARKQKPNLIILDLMLPGIDGIEICKVLKNNESTSHISVIILTAKGEEADKVIGLELGADDYITKPFSPRELVARVKAVLRRAQDKHKEKVLRSGNLEIDTLKHVVTCKKKAVELTTKEYDLLKVLMAADGRVLSRESLLEQVWGYDQSINIETRTVDMHILQLRKKLKLEAERIVTVKNVGYRFDCDRKIAK